MLEEKILIWKVKNGDKQALRKIYEKYKDDLVTLAVSLLGVKNDAEDILHDVFISFVKTTKRFRLSGSLRKHLITCAIDHIRHRHYTKTYEVVEKETIEEVGSKNQGADGQAGDNEESKIFIEGLSKIPVQQREVIVLNIQAEMKFGEIAKMQGTSINTVRARYNYGIEALRTILNGIIVE